MNKELPSENNFDQSLVSETAQGIITKHANRLKEHREAVVARIQSYPKTYEEYAALDLTSRLKAAVTLFCHEAPDAKEKNHFTFDISSLVDTEDEVVQATMAYSQGAWTNALNSTHIDKNPHLAIHLVSSFDGAISIDHLADLEMFSHYEEKGYKSYTFTHNSFAVAERGYINEPRFTDLEHPLFRDVVTIVDVGVAELYKRKLTGHIEKVLGAAALRNKDS